jgi:hypothetical protein
MILSMNLKTFKFIILIALTLTSLLIVNVNGEFSYCINGYNKTSDSEKCETQEQILIEKLLRNYNYKARPPAKPIEIKFALNLNQIINLLEKDQIIVINAFIDHEWIDNRLKWDPAHHGNLTLVRISGQLLWTPDTFIYVNKKKTKNKIK